MRDPEVTNRAERLSVRSVPAVVIDGVLALQLWRGTDEGEPAARD